MNTKTENTLDAGQVQRFHSAVHVNPKQSVAEHSWGVAVIAMALCRSNRVDTRIALEHAILHDTPELYTGDIPFQVKRNTEVKSIFNQLECRTGQHLLTTQCLVPNHIAGIVKIADMLEGMRYASKHDSEGTVLARWASAIMTAFQHSWHDWTVESQTFLREFYVAHCGKPINTIVWPDAVMTDDGSEPTAAYVNQD